MAYENVSIYDVKNNMRTITSKLFGVERTVEIVNEQPVEKEAILTAEEYELFLFAVYSHVIFPNTGAMFLRFFEQYVEDIAGNWDSIKAMYMAAVYEEQASYMRMRFGV